MSHIVLTGAQIFKMSIETGSAGPFCLCRIRADYSAAAREALDWPELPSGSNLMDLEEAEIPYGNLVLTSQQQNLNGEAPACLQLKFSTADTFRVVRVKGKKGAASFVQVRFNLKTLDETAPAAVFAYKSAVKKGLAELRIAWGEDAKEIPAVLELKQEDDRPVSAAAATKGHRGKKSQRQQLAAAVEAEQPTAEESQPMETSIVDEYLGAIEHSLDGESLQ